MKKTETAADKQVRTFQAGRPFVPGGAKAWLLSLVGELDEDDGDVPVALIDLAQTFMTMDEASAVEVAGALKEIMALVEAEDPSVKALVDKDVDDAAEGALMLAALRLSQLNPKAAVEFIKGLPEGGSDEATMFVFARLASRNPALAESMLSELSDYQRKHAVEGILNGILSKDPAAALAIAERYPDDVNDFERNNIIERLTKRDARQGIAAAIRVTESTRNTDLLRGALDEWIKNDADAAHQWAENYTGPGEIAVRGKLLEEKVKVFGAQDTMQEFAILQQTATDQKDLAGAACAIAAQLSEKDIPSALAWVTSLPAGPARERSILAVTLKWIREDTPAASQWIASLPDGEEKDGAVVPLVSTIKRRDPAAAFAWARNIQDEDQREQATREVMKEWVVQDPDAAKAAQETLPPEKVKEGSEPGFPELPEGAIRIR